MDMAHLGPFLAHKGECEANITFLLRTWGYLWHSEMPQLRHRSACYTRVRISGALFLHKTTVMTP